MSLRQGTVPGLESNASWAILVGMAEADLNFIARQNERLITDMASLRDDMRVLTAIVMRLDSAMGALTQEMRVTHTQMARVIDRVRKLEDASE